MELLSKWLGEYSLKSLDDYDRAVKEIIQQVCLLGLWRARFFERAAFYGGTALRLLCGLDRFSEDIDFTLLVPDTSFQLSRYFLAIQTELDAFGLETEIRGKSKSADSAIESAFIKANIRIHFLKIGVAQNLIRQIPSNKILKVKFEVDVDPAVGVQSEIKLLLKPIAFSARTVSSPDLFAGKMHALLYRRWLHRVKGRDWYDLVWFVEQDIPLRLKHLSRRMHQSGDLPVSTTLDVPTFRNQIEEAIKTLNIEQARNDVRPFIEDQSRIDQWSHSFFREIVSHIRFV
ncbi:MAG: nucleotidyl transferase AbiEii/AbiGii toxin family protein [Candidatus Marinimicrobia bacterium]|nr:nucleotidyl transferase AbiEii/AbiGii toxin family protein [Candidatus Neomarinimicrobiota bacterium]